MLLFLKDYSRVLIFYLSISADGIKLDVITSINVNF